MLRVQNARRRGVAERGALYDAAQIADGFGMWGDAQFM
jgi:hypothetical protein